MREFERRRCLRCGTTMYVVDGSERTTRVKVFFTLRCPNCGHTELDWYERNGKSRSE